MVVFTARMKRVAPLIRSVITFRLLHTLPDHLNFVDYVQLRTVDLAAELNTDSGSISRSLKELLELGIVEREGKGPRTAWRLSSDYGWLGNVEQFHAFRNGRLKGKKPPAALYRKSHNEDYGKSYTRSAVASIATPPDRPNRPTRPRTP